MLCGLPAGDCVPRRCGCQRGCEGLPCHTERQRAYRELVSEDHESIRCRAIGSGVHVLRHSAAKLRRDVGESIEAVSRFLDHANLAVTTTYLRRLEGEEDTGWRKVAALLD